MPLNDLQLIDEILGGSRAAFDQLIRRHESLVYRVAYSYVRDPEAALDISQNVFIKVHGKLESFQRHSAFNTWLMRIARNESLNWLSAQKRHAGHVDVTSLEGPSCPPPQEAKLVRAERARDLLAEVERLNPRQRRAVQLRYFEKRPIREIGADLDCSEGQVKNILFRSLRKLRQHLSLRDGWEQELGT